MNSTPVKGVLDRRFESAFQNADSASQNKHERSPKMYVYDRG